MRKKYSLWLLIYNMYIQIYLNARMQAGRHHHHRRRRHRKQIIITMIRNYIIYF